MTASGAVCVALSASLRKMTYLGECGVIVVAVIVVVVVVVILLVIMVEEGWVDDEKMSWGGRGGHRRCRLVVNHSSGGLRAVIRS